MEDAKSERNACEVEMTDANHLWIVGEDDSDSPLLVNGRSVGTDENGSSTICRHTVVAGGLWTVYLKVWCADHLWILEMNSAL
ncbi:hypothetical protein ACLOJK_009481 [Asimina triloba]